MPLKITRKKDERVIKAILHRIADIPNGVTVKVANLGGAVLFEGTPLCKGENGLFEVVKTAKVVTAYTSGTSLEVAKGHHFVAGEIISPDGIHTATISAIDKTNAEKDVMTLGAGIGVAVAAGGCISLVTLAKKEATAVGTATTSANTIKVAKGHNFHVGDIIAGKAASKFVGVEITNIAYGETFDIITVASNFSVAIAADDVIIGVKEASDAGSTASKQQTYPVPQAKAVAIAGSYEDVKPSENLFVSAWLFAVVEEGNAPVVNDAIKSDLKGIIYV